MMRPGAPEREAIAVAATGSVGARMAPSVKAAAQLRSSTTACATTPTPSVVKTTSPIASSPIGRLLSLRSRSEEKKAAEYRSAGRKSTSTASGASSTSGSPGM